MARDVGNPSEVECRDDPSWRVRYCTRGAISPVATSASASPRSSSMSRVEGWNVEARDSRLSSLAPSNTVTGTPCRTSAAAALKPPARRPR